MLIIPESRESSSSSLSVERTFNVGLTTFLTSISVLGVSRVLHYDSPDHPCVVDAVVLIGPRRGKGVGEVAARAYPWCFRAPPVRPRDGMDGQVLVCPHHRIVHPDDDRYGCWVEAARAARVCASACARRDVHISTIGTLACHCSCGRRSGGGCACLARGDFELVVCD